jgi:Tfp pilus assembly protein PilE
MKLNQRSSGGSTLVVVIIVVVTLLVLLGVAVDYSTQISRNTQRSRKTALAMEIADGHLEYLFTNWRNIYRTTWTTVYGSNTGGTDYSLVGTNYFYTLCPSCTVNSSGAAPTPVSYMTPSATPPSIPLPSTTLFPTEPNYTVTQYRIQAVDPMITLDNNGNAQAESGSKGGGSYGPMSASAQPPAGFGPNPAYGITGGFPYSYYYLASVDVTVPALAGNVTAKVRRVFEKKFDLPWSYMMFYVDDLELQPIAALSISGPIHTNSSLYIGTSNFTTNSRVEYGTNYVNGYSPNDSRYGNSVTSPNFAKSDAALSLSDCPPAQTSPYLPFGWNLKFSPTGANSNDGYREIIEQPAASPSPDPLASVRMYNQAGLRVQIDSAGNITAQTVDYSTTPATVSSLSGGSLNTIKGFVSTGTTSNSTLSSSYVFYDNREAAYIKATNVDVYQLTKAVSSISNWNGVVYISDTSATLYNTDGTVRTAGTAVNVTYGGSTYATTKRGIRLINGGILPSSGLTIVTDNPVYIVGDYNVNPNGSTSGGSPPSPAPTPASDVSPAANPAPNNVVSGTQRYAAIMGDAITVLSKNWVDTNSTGNVTSQSRWAANTTINSCLVAGNTTSAAGVYGGGAENFVRFLEDWNHNTNYFTYYGSMVQLYKPQQAIGAWTGSGNVYKAPIEKWYYDDDLLTAGAPPGNLDVAAYLQQQRWYEVY